MLTRFKSLARNAAIYSLGTISTKIAGFILLPLYTSHFSIADYGIIGILEVTSQLIISVCGLGLYSALNRWYWDAQYDNRQRTIFSTVLYFLSALVLLLVVGIFFLAPFLSQLLFSEGSSTYLIRLIGLSSGMAIIGQIPLTLMRLQEKPVLFSSTNLLRMASGLLLTVVLVVHLGHGIASIYEAQIIGHLIFLISISLYVIRNLTLDIDRKLLWEMLRFSLPMILASMSGILLTITDRYALLYLSDLKATGIYSLAVKLVNTVRIFIGQSVTLALTPVLYKMMSDPNHKRFYSKTLTYFALGLVYVLMGLTLFSKELVHVVARNKDYWPAFQLVPLLGFAVLFDLLKNVTAIGINIRKKTRTTAWVIATGAVINILLNLWLVPIYSGQGAAVATLFSQLFVFSGVYYFAQKYYPVPYELAKLMKIVSVSILITLTVLFLNQNPLIVRLIIKGFALLVFPITLYFWGFFEPIELQRLRELRKRYLKI